MVSLEFIINFGLRFDVVITNYAAICKTKYDKYIMLNVSLYTFETRPLLSVFRVWNRVLTSGSNSVAAAFMMNIYFFFWLSATICLDDKG